MGDRTRETPLRTLLLLGWDQFLPRIVVGGRARRGLNPVPVPRDTTEAGASPAGVAEQSRIISDEPQRPGEKLLITGFNGIEAQRRDQPVHPQVLDLNQMVSGAEKTLRRLLGEDVEFEARLERVQPVMADPGQIEQVIVNLVAHARDAIPHGGRLIIATETTELPPGEAFSDAPEGTYAVLTVSIDLGNPRGKAQALLDTVHHILEQSGGSLHAGRVPESWITARVFLPCVPEPLRREVSNDLPLSFAQQRLWFLDRLEPGNATFNMPAAVRMRGPLHVAALERALSEVVRRHESLRMSFTAVDGEPVQRIEPADTFHLRVEDLTVLTESQAEEEVARRAAEDAFTPFDLEAGPVFRARILRVSGHDTILLVAMHRIACDESSMGIFWSELAALYSAFSRGEPSPLPELPVRYADFVAWQRDWLSGERLERQVAWWTAHLAGAPTLLKLPTDRPRPVAQSNRGGDVRFAVPTATAAALKELVARERATLNMVILAAWSLFLSRWSGQDDVVVGIRVAGRPRVELEGLIGCFANTLAIRTDLSGAPSFRELLARVREAVLGAYAHQDLPFERLVEALRLERSLGHSPVYQVDLVMQNAPEAPGGFPALELTRLEREGESWTKVDLTLTVLDRTDGGMAGSLTYAIDLWEAETIARMAGHFSALLRAAAEAPNTPILSLEMLDPAEREQVVQTFNATEHPGYAETLVHQRVSAQAARTPDAAAVEMAGAQLTYAQLEARANRLARRLAAVGVGPETPVAICLERSLDLPVTVLAVLKAGGAYVAVHPNCPAERMAYMVADSGADVVVTTSDVAAWLPLQARTVLLLDHEAERIAGEPAEPLEVRVDVDNLCYVLYTSGSTGRPKAAGLPHRVLANLLRWQVERAAGPRAARTLQFASLSFDVSFQEIFGAWSTGGTLVLVDEETRRDAERLLAHLRREQVERVFLPFAALQNLAEAAEGVDAHLPHLREVVTAGEALRSSPQLRAFFLANPKTRLDNQYGPSETHVVTAHRVEEDPADWSLLPPIGAPIDNVRVYVLNAALSPVPVGVPGEVYAGGACVARGYLGRPALTAERFLPDPFSTEPGARLYRTGDSARWRRDGTLEFLGRMDYQVKVRGFRVEPGEVEAVLGDHPGVREVVVAARGEGAERRLAAYVVPVEGGKVSATDLRSHLAERLPDYMVPADWVVLDQMPLTPSGKVDRRALPEPDVLPPALVEPRTPAEEVVAEIWAEVLRLERVSVEDNFFELGGHSLLATLLVARVRAQTGVSLPLRSLFEHPTVAGMAAEVERLVMFEVLENMNDQELAVLIEMEKEGHAEST